MQTHTPLMFGQFLGNFPVDANLNICFNICSGVWGAQVVHAVPWWVILFPLSWIASAWGREHNIGNSLWSVQRDNVNNCPRETRFFERSASKDGFAVIIALWKIWIWKGISSLHEVICHTPAQRVSFLTWAVLIKVTRLARIQFLQRKFPIPHLHQALTFGQ